MGYAEQEDQMPSLVRHNKDLQSQLKESQEKIAELDYRREAVVVLSGERIQKLESDLKIAKECLEQIAKECPDSFMMDERAKEALWKLCKT